MPLRRRPIICAAVSRVLVMRRLSRSELRVPRVAPPQDRTLAAKKNDANASYASNSLITPVDVHRYLLIRVGGTQITLDVTFPDGEPWDCRSSLPLACGSGEDVAAGDNPTRTSERLKHATVTPLCETHSSRHSQPLLRRAAADRHQAVRRDHRYHRGVPITHRRRGRQIRTKFRKAAAQM